ncbi:MAG: response regulator [Defluviitaleaceae bacterium]|nr:response regulator [Defluviitaleaceae bacterium]
MNTQKRSRKLAVRARILYFAILTVAVIILLTIGIFVSLQIADHSARQLARQYSIEAASNFHTSINPHFVLMQQISRSTTISRWLADEHNEDHRVRAFDEIMGYVMFSPNTRVMFTAYNTMHGYDFHTELTLNDFQPWGTLAGGTVSQWFYDTRDYQNPFILNIQRERPELIEDDIVLFIWANHRMYYQNEFVGVLTVGFPFDDVFHAMFGKYDEIYIRGYLIDGNGLIRSDSAGALVLHDMGIPTPIAIPETVNNPTLAAVIEAQLEMMNGGLFTSSDIIPDVIALTSSDYRYASISPIVGTAWSILVLSNDTNGFGFHYIALVASAILVVFLAALATGIMMNNVVFNPLFSLSESAERNGTTHHDIFGTSRDDEIGELARAISSSRETMIYREKLLDAITQAAKILLAVREADNTQAVIDSMEIIGKCVDVDRIQIWHAKLSEDEQYFALNYQWASELGVQKAYIPSALKHDHDAKGVELLSSREIINTIVSTMSADEIKYMEHYGILSIAIIPLFLNDTFIGALSVEDCHNTRVFTADEMSAFMSAGAMLASMFNRIVQEDEIKTAAIAEEANRAKTRFLARMSHEIRTPITSVVGVSEIQLRHQNLPPDIKDAFGKINDSGHLLLGIVNDILDFSKIESGNMPLANQEYEVASLINDATQIHAVYLEHKNIRFEVKIDEHLPVYLIGDALRIRQIINNLLSNAFKYTEAGCVSLLLSYEGLQGDLINLTISIHDTGMGMTEAQIEALKTSEYTRFHEQEGFVSGTGLGISIVYSLAHLMNAQIDFKSEVGKGTVVHVCIPQKTCSLETIGKELARSLERFEMGVNTKKTTFISEPMPYGKVLVVDDVDANLFVAKGLLAFYDLRVETCSSGNEAIRMIAQGNVYDIIFMDHMMPGISGAEAMFKLRETGYTQPIIALTANALIGQAEVFIEKGFDDFISKPIQTKRLDEILIKYVRDKQPPEVIAEANAMAQVAKASHIDDFMNDEAVVGKLRNDFARDHKNTFEKIMKAIAAGDTPTAYRLVHTVKGLAGLISENALMDAAQAMENSLRSDMSPTTAQITTMEMEMARVLVNIAENTPKAEPLPVGVALDRSGALDALDHLIPLLKSRNVESTNALDPLRPFPEAMIIITQVEQFEFDAALKSAEVLKSIWS